MATLKKGKKILKSEKKNDNLIGPAKTTRLQASAKHGEKTGSQRNSAKQQSSVPLLDMLAEVASATLQNDRSLTVRKSKAIKIKKFKTRPIKKPTKADPKVKKKKSLLVVKTTKTLNKESKPKETAKEIKKEVKVIPKDEPDELTPEEQLALNALLRSSPTGDSSLKRTMQQANLLNLDQIRVLSDRMLLEMFSELTSDELKRQYAYKCFLVPEKCSEMFKSFGSETRARLQMKSHLLTHIAELLAEANGAASKTNKGKFMAEPLQARTRRLQESLLRKRHKPSIQPNKKPLSLTFKDKKLKASKKTVINAKKKAQNQSGKSTPKALASKTSKSPSNSKSSMPSTSSNSGWVKEEDLSGDEDSESDDPDSDDVDSDSPSSEDTANTSPVEAQTVVSVQPPLSPESIPQPVDVDQIIEPVGAFRPDYPIDNDNAIKYIVDTTDHPGHDHNYTTVMGKKRGIESIHFEYWGSSEDEDPEAEGSPKKSEGGEGDVKKRGYMYENPQLIVATPSFPFIYIPLLPNIAQILEVNDVKKERSVQKKVPVSSPVTPVPVIEDVAHSEEVPMVLIPQVVEYEIVCEPKPPRAKRGSRVIVPEEMEPLSSDDEDEISREIPVDEIEAENELAIAASSIIKSEFEGGGENMEEVESSDEMENYYANQAMAGGKFTNLIRPHEGAAPDWERKMALKYIRGLRTRRTKDRGPIVCKICKSRTFTAQATLMYHYRSHAGIKPFICNLCGATFTRQHSLNYHMLIHNNKSRFVCEACGRNFRHPSHYKEHLRRHTGETPYECADCKLRFKTRNTYKRHLKTRHGKILTAQGIITLSLEEFYKVRTNPRRRAPRAETTTTYVPIIAANANNNVKRDQETQWPENLTTLQAIQTIQELHLTEDGTLIEGYYECPPEAVAFQVIEATPSV